MLPPRVDLRGLVSTGWLRSIDRRGCNWPHMPVAGSSSLRQPAGGGSLKGAALCGDVRGFYRSLRGRRCAMVLAVLFAHCRNKMWLLTVFLRQVATHSCWYHVGGRRL
ncbi:hypothetical protein SORBI_3003G294550 [Sorghum bicolor]|uniref:Uncharacterized protein n=1 Tax=Sorghum bicolor TaxID=4558 RepID=A0A1W0VZJ1_SORBI|nr:hypothetical protein SORBI_3003G294550 [Sorghum bicolor]